MSTDAERRIAALEVELDVSRAAHTEQVRYLAARLEEVGDAVGMPPSQAKPPARSPVEIVRAVRARMTLDQALFQRDGYQRAMEIDTGSYGMTDQDLEQARAWAEAAEPYPVKRGYLTLLDEIERLRGIARNAADLLERTGYDETASRIRARVRGEAVGGDR